MSKSHKEESPVVDAVRTKSLDRLRAVLEQGADPDLPESGGFTALMEAVITGQNESVELLLDHGANVNAADDQDWTALHYAAQDDRVEIARRLVDSGADVNAADTHGNTPLWRGTFGGNASEPLIRTLIENGAAPDQKNKHGVSPRDLAGSVPEGVRRLFSTGGQEPSAS